MNETNIDQDTIIPPWELNLPGVFQGDMNNDGLFTISDVVLWFEWLREGVVWLFFLPGDTIIWLMMVYTPGVAIFLELSVEFYSGWMAGILSVIAWIIFLSITVIE